MDKFVKGGAGKSAKKQQTHEAVKKPLQLLPWVEKYRPKTVAEVAFQDDVVAVLKKCLDGSDLPNFLFYGPPGTGKTSAALAMAKELFGPEIYRDRVLELNASDERGIQVVREKVKQFAQYAASGHRPDGKSCPALKLVILDEADSMTGPAQAALRRTMERESRTTRFVLICNYITRIIDPLTSRCAKFRFKPLSEAAFMERINYICNEERVQISDAALKILCVACDGDLRKAITYLQTAAKFYHKSEISADAMAEISGIVPQHFIDEFLQTCRSGQYEKVELFVKRIIREGFPAYQLIGQIFDAVMEDPNLEEGGKAKISEKIAICDKRLLDGADEFLQMMDLACCVMTESRGLV